MSVSTGITTRTQNLPTNPPVQVFRIAVASSTKSYGGDVNSWMGLPWKGQQSHNAQFTGTAATS